MQQQIAALFSGPSDEHKFVGLLLLTKFIPSASAEDCATLAQQMPLDFLVRLFTPIPSHPPSQPPLQPITEKQFQQCVLGLQILSSFVQYECIAASAAVAGLVPRLLHAVSSGGLAKATNYHPPYQQQHQHITTQQSQSLQNQECKHSDLACGTEIDNAVNKENHKQTNTHTIPHEGTASLTTSDIATQKHTSPQSSASAPRLASDQNSTLPMVEAAEVELAVRESTSDCLLILSQIIARSTNGLDLLIHSRAFNKVNAVFEADQQIPVAQLATAHSTCELEHATCAHSYDARVQHEQDKSAALQLLLSGAQVIHQNTRTIQQHIGSAQRSGQAQSLIHDALTALYAAAMQITVSDGTINSTRSACSSVGDLTTNGDAAASGCKANTGELQSGQNGCGVQGGATVSCADNDVYQKCMFNRCMWALAASQALSRALAPLPSPPKPISLDAAVLKDFYNGVRNIIVAKTDWPVRLAALDVCSRMLSAKTDSAQHKYMKSCTAAKNQLRKVLLGAVLIEVPLLLHDALYPNEPAHQVTTTAPNASGIDNMNQGVKQLNLSEKQHEQQVGSLINNETHSQAQPQHAEHHSSNGSACNATPATSNITTTSDQFEQPVASDTQDVKGEKGAGSRQREQQEQVVYIQREHVAAMCATITKAGHRALHFLPPVCDLTEQLVELLAAQEEEHASSGGSTGNGGGMVDQMRWLVELQASMCNFLEEGAVDVNPVTTPVPAGDYSDKLDADYVLRVSTLNALRLVGRIACEMPHANARALGALIPRMSRAVLVTKRRDGSKWAPCTRGVGGDDNVCVCQWMPFMCHAVVFWADQLFNDQPPQADQQNAHKVVDGYAAWSNATRTGDVALACIAWSACTSSRLIQCLHTSWDQHSVHELCVQLGNACHIVMDCVQLSEEDCAGWWVSGGCERGILSAAQSCVSDVRRLLAAKGVVDSQGGLPNELGDTNFHQAVQGFLQCLQMLQQQL